MLIGAGVIDMSLLNSLPHRCTIQRLVRVAGDLGGVSYSTLIEQSSVLCWSQAATQREVTEFEKRGMKVTRKVYFSTNPQLNERHQIIITEMNGTTVTSPITLDVKAKPMPDSSAGKGVLYKVFCEENSGEND